LNVDKAHYIVNYLGADVKYYFSLLYLAFY